MRRGAIALIAFCLLASPAAGAPRIDPDRPDPKITDGSAQRALDAARARWKAAGLHDYSYGLSVQCFCRNGNEPVHIVVHGGRAGQQGDFPQFRTVPRIFRFLQKAIEQRASSYRARFGRYGRPVSARIDPSARIADEETGLEISGFRRLKPR